MKLNDEMLANLRAIGCTCTPEIKLGSLVRTTTGSVVAPLSLEHDDDCGLRVKFERVTKAALN